MSTPAFGSWKTKAAPESLSEFASDVRAGLRKPQKELHSKYLYDQLGSALFEAITHLPEYGLTRADDRLLCAHADEIAGLAAGPVSVIELGSGMGRKTRAVLSALRYSNPQLRYFPIDVSAEALARCERELADVAEVHARRLSYLDGMAVAASERRPNERLLILFLGSTIGNFERRCALEFLRDLRASVRTGDALLIGADLVKDLGRMLQAYDDPTGVTAAFNLNLLGRINRELGANFELRNFEHVACWSERERRIEMHLRARAGHSVSIAGCGLEVRFRVGETIWTESSHKFLPSELIDMAAQSGFQMEAQWVDREWPFVESYWTAR